MVFRGRVLVLALHGLWLCACNQPTNSNSGQPAASTAAGAAATPTQAAGAGAAAGSGKAGSPAFTGVSGVGANTAGMPAAGAAAAAAGAGAAGNAAMMSGATSGSDGSMTVGSSVLDRSQWQPYPEVSYPDENPYSAEKALLGKALFWDEQLSSDGTVACGTCHRPSAGGSDPRPAEPGYLGHPGPDGMRGTPDDPKGSPGIAACQQTSSDEIMPLMDETFGTGPRVLFRRAMTVLDAMFNDSMFWDARVGQSLKDPTTDEVLIPAGAALEAQALQPVLNPAEMACEGRDWEMAASKIAAAKPLALATELPADLQMAQQSAETYPPLFASAFGDDAVTPARIVMAIATYERTLTADQTGWDRWLAGDDDAMTDQEKRGFGVFVERGFCTCCHTPPLFAGSTLFDDGFHEHSFDGGAAQIGGMPGDYENPQFRTATIRNAGLREPVGLLHDGLAPGDSIEDLIAAYNKPPLRSVSVCRRALELTAEEQADLVAFVRGALVDSRAAMEQPPFDRPKLASEREMSQ